jgi:radical SAM superfamily enzyme YgiQ (UPF0313 family)
MKMLIISIDLSMGTRILVNVLKEKGHEAHNLQISGIRYSDIISEEALRNIWQFSREYDAVGLSFISFYAPLAARLGGYLKSKGLKWLITGGAHVTALPEDTMSYTDVAVVYEAEISLPKIAESIEDNKPLHDIDGIVFKDADGRTVKTGHPKFVTNLDQIPFQTYPATI